jgi:hypothetical protein
MTALPLSITRPEIVAVDVWPNPGWLDSASSRPKETKALQIGKRATGSLSFSSEALKWS